jgi:hypothetical protein
MGVGVGVPTMRSSVISLGDGSLLQRSIDSFHYSFGIPQYIVVPKPRDAKPGALQKPGTSAVDISRVLPTVDFHR